MKKAMKKMIMRKVLSCFVVFVILMSTFSVAALATGSSNDTDISTAKTVSSLGYCSYVWIEITDKYCKGYEVYVDGVYQFTEGEDSVPDGYCRFKVTPGYHTFKLTLNGKQVSKGWNCQCGTGYNWMSMNDMIPHWCEGGGNDNPTDEYEVKFRGTVTSTAPSEYDCGFKDVYICEVKIEKVVSGDYFEKGDIVNIVSSQWRENAHVCGTYDKVSVGDTVEVYGEMIPIYCMGTWITICGKSSYYLKKISSESLSINVWTDKSEYKIGETVTINYQTNKKCTAKLTITKPDGGDIVYGPNEIPACTRSKSATAGYPTGKRTVVFEAWAGSEYKKATCYFDVVEEKKPDLIIKDISWSPSSPDNGDTIKFTVKIKNQGSGSAGSSTVKYYVDGSYVNYDSVPALSAGSTSTQTFTWTANKCGNVQVKAVADANNAVDEGSNDGNNDRSETINVICGEKPAPEIIKVSYPTTCVKEGEYATISVTVKNNGGASSEGYISVSFPNDEQIFDVSGTGSTYNKLYPKGSWIWNNKDQQMESVDPLVELLDTNWDAGEKHALTMNVKPNSGSDEIVFYVRAALKNDVDGDYERDPTYSSYKDQQGWYVKKYSVGVCDYEKVKFRGEILVDHPIISYYSFDVKIDKVLEDPTGNLQEGETVKVYGHRSGPAQVDDVTVGDEVEVYGEYRGYVGSYEQIFLSEWGDSSSDHYMKKIKFSFELISPNPTSELELYKTHNIPIKVKSATMKGGTIVASLKFTSKFGNSQREEIINLNDDNFDGIYEYDYSLELFEQIAIDSINASIKIQDAETVYNSICDYFSSTIGTYKLTLKYYDASSEKTEYLYTQSRYPIIGLGWMWKIEKFINELKPPSEQIWGGHWTTLEDVQEGMTKTVLYLSEDNEATAYIDLTLQCMGPIGLIYGLTLSNCLRVTGNEDKAVEMLYKTLGGFVIELTPAGWAKTFYDVAKDLSIIFKGEKIFILRSECPINLHMYDSSNNHVGLDEYGNPETEIPYSIYVQDENGDFEGILIIDFDLEDFYEVVIEGTGNGKFNLTSEIIGQDKKQKIAYLNVPVYTNTIATVDVSKANPTYTMEIDNNGDGTTDKTKEPDSIETDGQDSYSIQLHTGWNLISLPILPDDSDVLDVMSSVDGNWNSVWSFENGEWKRYDLTGPDFLNDLTTMETGKGYWINMKSDDTTFSVSGSEPTVKSISLASGWNLVGYNSLSSTSTTDAMSSVDGNWNSVWSFENGEWKRYDLTGPGFLNDLTTMEPGKGYWINMESPDTWILGE